MAVSPYATVTPLARPVPAHVTNEDDVLRVRAYSTYEDIWNNVPEAFAALLRADDDPLARRYLPMVREIVESINRYLAHDMETVWTPIPGNTVTDEQIAEWRGRLDAFWAREEVGIKFMSSKRWTLIKGDGLLHITADPTKPEGGRIRISEVEAEQYFPIYDPADGERILGCYLVSVVKDDSDEDVVQRIEYRKVVNDATSAALNGAPVGTVFYRLGFFELDGWDDRKPEDETTPVDAPAWAAIPEGAADPFAGYALPTQITSIPVYHIRNRRRGGLAGRFGTSEIQGLESILAGVIQNATDEDLTVAMQGLGVYWTTSGKARDSSGKEVPWVIGPRSIAELEPDGELGRVEGINTVQPYLDHINLLNGSARGAAAAPAVAGGSVNSEVSLSGVALRIQFMPVLAANAERESEMASKWSQILYDLMNMWFPAYEGWNPLPLQPSVVFGDPLPPDREAIIKEITDLLTAGVISKEFAVAYLAEKLGFQFPEGMLKVAQAEQQAALDAEGARIAAEAGQLAGGE